MDIERINYPEYETARDRVVDGELTHSEALKDIVLKSIPAMLALLIRRSVEMANYVVVGRMPDPGYTSGVGMGILTSNIFCVSIGIGFAGGLDTLCSQAFGNNKNYLAG